MIGALPSRLATAMMALAGAGFCQPFSVQVVPESVVNRPFPALRDGQPVEIEWRSLQFRVAAPYRNALCDLVLLREPTAGQSIWFVWIVQDNFPYNVRLDNPAGVGEANQAVRIDQGTMRAFVHVSSLMILGSKARADSMDAAQKLALADFIANGHPDETGTRWWAPSAHRIRLDNLPKSLTPQPPAWWPPPRTRVRAHDRSGRCWSLEIASSTETARLLVDDAYDLATAEECAKPAGRGAHVSLARSDPPVAVAALRNNKPTTVEFHSALAQVIYPDGRSGQVHVLMLYDPKTRLFWWRSWPPSRNHPTPSDAEVEQENKLLLGVYSLFLKDDRLLLFSSRTVSDSTERHPDFHTAQSAVLAALEAARGDIEVEGGGMRQRMLPYTDIPRDFFRDCMNAMAPVIELKRVARLDGLWKLTITGTYASSGNSAVLSLNDNYDTVGVELFRREPARVFAGGASQMVLPMGCGETESSVDRIFESSPFWYWPAYPPRY